MHISNALNEQYGAVEQYWAAQPNDMPDMALIVRSAGEPGSLAPVVKTISAGLNASIFPEIRQLKALYRENVQQIENVAAIVSLVGLVAVLVAAVGLVGLVAFVVTQRKKDIAIRMALGAGPVAVLTTVLQQFRWPLFTSLATGTMLAALGSRLLRVAIYGVNNLDPASCAAALGVLASIAALSMLVPAARALRLNLASVLHHE